MSHVAFQGEVAQSHFFRAAWQILTRASAGGDAAWAPQRVINHNCFNSINDPFRKASAPRRNVSSKYMNWLGFQNRDGEASSRPNQLRASVARSFGMPVARHP